MSCVHICIFVCVVLRDCSVGAAVVMERTHFDIRTCATNTRAAIVPVGSRTAEEMKRRDVPVCTHAVC